MCQCLIGGCKRPHLHPLIIWNMPEIVIVITNNKNIALYKSINLFTRTLRLITLKDDKNLPSCSTHSPLCGFSVLNM